MIPHVQYVQYVKKNISCSVRKLVTLSSIELRKKYCVIQQADKCNETSTLNERNAMGIYRTCCSVIYNLTFIYINKKFLKLY